MSHFYPPIIPRSIAVKFYVEPPKPKGSLTLNGEVFKETEDAGVYENEEKLKIRIDLERVRR